jgi:hypothetical protein
MAHHSNIPLFQHPIIPSFHRGGPLGEDGRQAGRAICQNKANFQEAQMNANRRTRKKL